MINQERLIKTFLEIIKIDSPSGFEQAMIKYVRERLAALGIENFCDKFGNVIAKIKGSNCPLLFVAHLDTVEPGRGIIPTVEKGIVKSRGKTILGADNKSGVAAILEMATAASETSLNHPEIEIVFTLSEEVANLGAVNLDYSSIRSKQGFSFDSSSPVGTIIMASPFYNSFDITILGKEAHAGHPERAVNALKILGGALRRLPLGIVDEKTLLNIGVIDGGYVRNTIPGMITLKGEVRSFEEKNLETATRKVIELFTEAAKLFGGNIRYEVIRENGGFKFCEEEPLVQQVISAVKNLNLEPILKETSGCYDANIFHDRGIKILNLGNGTKDNHTVNERISIKDLVLTAELALKLLKPPKR